MLLIGNDNLGRLDIVIDTIVNQGREGVRCVYVSTSGKHEEVVQRLRAAGAMKYTTVVAADASQQQLGESVVAAASGCSIAEFWRGQGWDTLVVVNDLEAHRQFWDYTDRVLIQASPAPRHDCRRVGGISTPHGRGQQRQRRRRCRGRRRRWLRTPRRRKDAQ